MSDMTDTPCEYSPPTHPVDERIRMVGVLALLLLGCWALASGQWLGAIMLMLCGGWIVVQK